MAERLPLTPVQQGCLDTIRGLIAAGNGVGPSIRDIQRALGVGSRGYVHTLVGRLEQRGHLTRERGRARTIRLTAPDSSAPIVDLIRLMAVAVPSSDGMVRVVIPQSMVSAAVAALPPV